MYHHRLLIGRVLVLVSVVLLLVFVVLRVQQRAPAQQEEVFEETKVPLSGVQRHPERRYPTRQEILVRNLAGTSIRNWFAR